MKEDPTNVKGGGTCGGTILNEETILSAAHCFYGKGTIQVKVEVGFAVHINKTNPRKLGVRKYYNHPNYNPQSKENDIAILKLKKPLKFRNKVGPAFLPYASFNPEESGLMGLLSGFGSIRFGLLGGSGKGGGSLHFVNLPFVTNGDCQQKFDEGPYVGKKITSKMLCAGYTEGGKNSCKGDSGFYLRPSKLLPAFKRAIVQQIFDFLQLFNTVLCTFYVSF